MQEQKHIYMVTSKLNGCSIVMYGTIKTFFENGMVIRKFMDNIVISTIGGTLLCKKLFRKMKNIIQKIIPGDILYED